MEIATLSAIMGGIGAATSAIGAIAGGESRAAEARYGAQVSTNNQIIANQNAAYAAAAGEQHATNASLRSAATLGRIKAAQGASGIDVNTGSAVDVQKSERETGELSAMTAENNALLQAYGYRTQATSFGAQSQLQTAEAQQAPFGAALAAGGGLLGNASALGFKWNTGTAGPGGNLSSDAGDA